MEINNAVPTDRAAREIHQVEHRIEEFVASTHDEEYFLPKTKNMTCVQVDGNP